MRQCPHCKVFDLTPNEKSVMEIVKAKGKAGILAHELQTAHKRSISQVSTELKRLADTGFLWREQVNAPSGGLEFRYWRTKP